PTRAGAGYAAYRQLRRLATGGTSPGVSRGQHYWVDPNHRRARPEASVLGTYGRFTGPAPARTFRGTAVPAGVSAPAAATGTPPDVHLTPTATTAMSGTGVAGHSTRPSGRVATTGQPADVVRGVPGAGNTRPRQDGKPSSGPPGWARDSRWGHHAGLWVPASALPASAIYLPPARPPRAGPHDQSAKPAPPPSLPPSDSPPPRRPDTSSGRRP
ncbi:MAG: hypothetical protein ACRD0H_18740, partial [Actinomycetes bacterium]